jgi:hypothetical protein
MFAFGIVAVFVIKFIICKCCCKNEEEEESEEEYRKRTGQEP